MRVYGVIGPLPLLGCWRRLLSINLQYIQTTLPHVFSTHCDPSHITIDLWSRVIWLAHEGVTTHGVLPDTPINHTFFSCALMNHFVNLSCHGFTEFLATWIDQNDQLEMFLCGNCIYVNVVPVMMYDLNLTKRYHMAMCTYQSSGYPSMSWLYTTLCFV